MKNAIIFHGTGCTPEMFWYPYVKQELEEKDYEVRVPQLPLGDVPDIKVWLPFALENGKYTKDTVLIGHSAGCPLILSVLEKIKVKVRQAVLVAGFSEQIFKLRQPILQGSYNWQEIKNKVTDLIFINSDDDPYGCDDKASKKMFDNLGGTQIILHGEGHMGSNKFSQPYKEFPLLVKLIE